MSLILFLIFSSFKSLYAWFFRVDEIMKKSANSSQCNVLNSIATSPVQWMRYLNISESSSKFTNSYSFKVLLLSSLVYIFEGSSFRDVNSLYSMINPSRKHQIKTKSNTAETVFIYMQIVLHCFTFRDYYFIVFSFLKILLYL